MNKMHRLVWNNARQCWVAVGEHARGRGKGAKASLLGAIAALGAIALPAWVQAQPASVHTQAAPAPNALPSGGQVVAGQATITHTGDATLTINQGSARTAINWNNFDVGSQAQVNFVQPGANAVALNQVQGNNPSQIFGRINANGQVFLSNPNGVYFAPSASVDVGGLVATTHTISLDDFMAGRIRFDREGATGSVVNEGQLRAALGGYIALLAPQVRNQGVILARLGTVALAAGETFELQFDGNNTLAGLRVTPSSIAALVDNRSAVLAPGGLIILSAQALDKVQGGVIQNSGRIEASGLSSRGGRIVLDASTQVVNTGHIAADATAEGPAGSVGMTAPQVTQAGTVDARGIANQPGGTVSVSAGQFVQADAGRIDVSAPVQGGTVKIHASAQAVVAGQVDASATADVADVADVAADGHGRSQGGAVEVKAAQVSLTNATVDASGGIGGHVWLDASTPAQDAPIPPLPAPKPGQLALSGATVVSTRGRKGSGGSTTLLGDDIGLNDGTALDASGATGGGTVLVGGMGHGSDALYQATTVGMGTGATIDADARDAGTGGTVVLWSNVGHSGSATLVDGRISALGAAGGLGGQVETSGHLLGIGADASVRTGAGGTWLLDPADVTITNSDSNYSNLAGTLTPNSGANTVSINASTVSAALATGNVTITTSNTGTAGTGTGYITVNSAITKTSGGDSTLTLEAAADVKVNASIGSTSGKLNLVLVSDWDSAQGGSVAISGATINTNGGALWIGGNGYGPAYGTTTWQGLTVAQGSADAANLTSGVPGIGITNSTITTAGGNVSMNGLSDRYNNGENRYGVLMSGSSLNSGSGSVSITGMFSPQTGTLSSQPATYGVDLESSTITATTGAITLTGGQGATEVAYNSGLYGVRLFNSTVSTTGATGDINFTGTVGTDNGSGNGSLDGVQLAASGANALTKIATVGGSINITGTANTNNAANSYGIEWVTAQPTNADATNPAISVVSRTGNVTLTGDNPNNTNTSSAGIIFNGANYGKLFIGYDGSNAYSGNTTLTGRTVVQTNMGTGYLQLGGTGALTIQPTTGSFTSGASTAATEDFNGYWTFGSTHSALTLGRDSLAHQDTVTVDQALTVNGPLSIYADYININYNLTTTAPGAGILLKGTGNIIDANNIALATNGGAITFWADSDGDGAGYTLLNDGATLDSRTASDRTAGNTSTASGGGAITLSGGTNLATGYATANNTANRGGVNFGDQTVDNNNVSTLYSGGGAVLIRGKATGSQSVMGVNWVNTGLVNAGSTGTIEIDGVSNGGSHGMELGSWHTSGTLTLLAGGGSAGSAAITLNGSTNTSNGIQAAALLLEATGAGGISLTGTGGSGQLGIAISASNAFQALAASGPISVNGGAQGMALSGVLGAKSGTAVTSSTSAITLTGDSVQFNNAASTTASSGALTIQPGDTSFTTAFSTSNLAVSVAPSFLTLGKTGNLGNVTLANAVTVAGGIDIEGGAVTLNGNLTSTATGNIFVKANTTGGSSVLVANGSITKTGGARSTLTLESAGRVQLQGNVSATGTVLDTILWSDTDNSKNDGGVSIFGNVSTNGGNLWAGGSSSNGGTYTWGGLTVGNGPSVGSANNNANAMDVNSTINTGGGNVLLWAGAGYGGSVNGIGTASTGSINAGSGSITLIANALSGSFGLSTTGTLSLLPNGGSYGSTLSWTGAAAGGNLTLNTGPLSGLVVNNLANLGGLTLGQYSGMSSGGSAVVLGNSSPVTVGTATTISGPVSVYGGNLTLSANLATTASGAGVLLNASGNISETGNITTNDGAVSYAASSGSISLTGTAGVPVNVATSGGAVTMNAGNGGVTLFDTAVTTGAGSIGVTGVGGTNAGGNQEGVLLDGATLSAITGNIFLGGTGGASTGNSNTGIRVQGGSSVGTTGGNIVLTGQGGGAGSANDNDGIAFNGPATVAGTTGSLTLNGAIGLNGNTEGISFSLVSGTATLGSASQSGPVRLNANVYYFGNGGANQVRGNGSLVIAPFTAGASFASTLDLTNLDIGGGFSSVQLGAAGNTGNITVGRAIGISGPVSVTGGNLAINAGLSATNNTLTLTSNSAITEGASGFVAANALAINGGTVTLNGSANAVGTLAAAGVGSFSFVDGQALTVGSVGSINGIGASGVVNVGTLVGDLTLAQNVATSNASNAALVLDAGISAAAGTAAGGNLLISGSPSITVGAGGTAKLYTGSVSNSTGLTALLGAGSGRFRYDSDETTTNFSLALATGLNAVYREQPLVTRVVDNQTVVYGNTATYTFSLAGDPNGDTYAQAFATAPGVSVGGSFSTGGYANAGAHTLSGSGGSSLSQLGLGVSGGITSGTLTVTPRALTASFTGTAKVYDGSTTAGVTDTDNRLAGDQLTVAWTGANFVDANAAVGKTVNMSGVGLSGPDQANYTVAGTGSTTASITPRTVTLSGSKVYDGTVTLGAGAVTLGNLVGNETLAYTGATASNAHVATSGKYVSAITLADGSGLAANYQLPTLNPANAAVTITPRTLSAGAGIVGSTSKTYDGGIAATGASVGGGSIGNAVAGDTLAVDASGVSLAYDSAHVATASQIVASGNLGFTVTGSASGSLASDYTLPATGVAPVAASITPATLTAALNNGGVTKVYDGGTSAPAGFVPSYAFTGLVAGDTGAAVANTGAAYDSKDVVSASQVTVSGMSLTGVTGNHGSQPSDYLLGANSASIGATITPKPVSVGGLTASDKTYDGTANASITHLGSVSGLVGSETLGLSATSATFSDPNAGSAKTVTASGYALANGTGLASNYQLSATTATTTADIARALLTVTANNDAKFVTQADASGYNGVSIDGFVNGETASVLSGAATVSRSNAGQQMAGTYTGVLLADTAGLSAANYHFQTHAGDYTIVGSNQLLVQVVNNSTVYGSTPSYAVASASYFNGATVVGLGAATDLGGGRFTVNDGAGGSATFTLVPGNATTSGAGLTAVGSYQLAATQVSTQNAQNFGHTLTIVGSETVVAKGLVANTTNGLSKVYDGSNAMIGVTLGLDGLVGGDTVTVSGNGAFSAQNAGNHLAFTVSGVTLGGADAGDYFVTGGATLSGNNGSITPRTLTLAGSKTYDGTPVLGAGAVTLGNLVAGETLGYGGASANDAHVATPGKYIGAITLVDGSGLASNYQLPALDAAGAPVTIAPKLLSPSAAIVGATSKVYDAGTAAVGASVAGSVAGAVSGDTLVLDTSGVTLAYDSAHVVSASQIAATGTAGLSIAASSHGSQASDYSFAAPAIAPVAASVTPRTLTVSYGGVDKVYDGQATATVTTSDNRLPGDALTLADSAAFSDKNVGTGKTVNLTGVKLGGASASDYTVSATGSTTASITQLASVTWVGGSSGNWFDPANWAGGAVPDLANVANVVIPANVTVSFDPAGAVGGAQTGPVQINSLGAAGKLVQAGGTLDVGGGGVALDSIVQNGGNLASAGPVTVASLTQTGGSFGAGGALTVSNQFSETGTGSITVGGDAKLTNTGGNTAIGNLAVTGALAIASPDGDIVQGAGTTVAVGGSTTLNAGTHDITLDGAGNGFVGPVSASGHDITLVDGQAGLVLANLQASGSLSLASLGGNLTQAPGSTVKVAGTTSLVAPGFDITLAAAGNLFGGAVSASGHDITLVNGGSGLTLGQVVATGNLNASTAQGDLTQVPGTGLTVAGTTGLGAPGGWVRLVGDNSFGAGLSSQSGATHTVPTVVVPVVPAPVLPQPDTAPPALAMPGNLLNGSAAADAGPLSGGNLPDPGRHASADARSVAADGVAATAAVDLATQAPTPAARGVDDSGLTVRILRLPSDDTTGAVEVIVPAVQAARGFSFGLPGELLPEGSSRRASVKVARADGKRMWQWLRFDKAGMRIVANAVPQRALPAKLVVDVGGRRTALTILRGE